jgi:nitroreductase/NAD-dependent dihydropyrimidine dehydrogenase PreA subunit
MHLFTVNTETCTRCGTCVVTCPGSLIHLPKNGYPRPIPGADKGCVRCGHCVAVCPTGSLSHRDMAVTACTSAEKKLPFTAAQFDQFVRNRRSIRTYKDQPAPKETLLKIIDTVRYAPSGHNSQPVEWLVITGEKELQRIRGLLGDWLRWVIVDKPDLAELLGLKPILKYHEAGKDPILRGAPAVVLVHAPQQNPFAVMACPIALTYFELVAFSMGLGCCWAGIFFRAATTYPPIMEALAIPPGHRVFCSMVVGYPKFSYRQVPARKEPVITWRE